MIKPAIKPTLAFRPISRGLITAARNSVNKVQESTQKISKGLNKNEKFAMNYVEFFGSKKTTKILKKNLKSIRDSLMSTFSMAKILKKKVAEMSKGGGLGAAGGALGGIAGILGKGLLGGVLGKLAIGALIGLAVGGIGFFLYQNAGKFFKFLDENIDQLTPIIEKIIKRTASKTIMPSGLPELIDELDENISNNVTSILKSDDTISKDEAVAQAVQLEINKLQEAIDEEKLKRSKLGFFDITGKGESNATIKRLEQAQNYLRTGDKFSNLKPSLTSTMLFGPGSSSILSGFNLFSNQFLGGTPVPTGYNNMTEKSRLSTVVNFVENSAKSLDALEFEVLRSQKLAGRFAGEGKTRFYEDVLNYIKAKKSPNGTKGFEVLPEEFDIGATKRGNIEEFNNRFGNLINYKSPKNKKGDLNIINGTPNNQNTNGGSKDTKISSAPPDSGIIDIAFYSPLNSDMAMERGTSKSILNVYMG